MLNVSSFIARYGVGVIPRLLESLSLDITRASGGGTLRIGITCYPTYGGSGVVATELGKELAMRGHDVHFISYALPIRLTVTDRIFFHEVEVLSYPLFEYPPYDLVLATKMAEVTARYNLDILHVHYAIPHSISAYLAKMMLDRPEGSVRHDTARNRHHARRQRPLVPSDHSLWHRAERRRYRSLAVPQAAND